MNTMRVIWEGGARVGRVIVITSGKGGVGKTSVTAGLGCALSMLGHPTVLVDLDAGLGKLDLITGVSDLSCTHWGDVLQENCSLEDALLQHPHDENLWVLPAPQTTFHDAFTEQQLADLYQTLAQRFTFVLLDCPPGAGLGFSHAVCGAEEALIVTQCETPAVRDCDRITSLLEQRGLTKLRMIINRYQENLVRHGAMLSVEEVLNRVRLPLAGIVSEDEAIFRACSLGQPISLSSGCPSAGCFSAIAHRLLGEEVPLTVPSGEGFFSRWKQAWRRL